MKTQRPEERDHIQQHWWQLLTTATADGSLSAFPVFVLVVFTLHVIQIHSTHQVIIIIIKEHTYKICQKNKTIKNLRLRRRKVTPESECPIRVGNRNVVQLIGRTDRRLLLLRCDAVYGPRPHLHPMWAPRNSSGSSRVGSHA